MNSKLAVRLVFQARHRSLGSRRYVSNLHNRGHGLQIFCSATKRPTAFSKSVLGMPSTQVQQRFLLSALPPVLIPPALFVGLLLGLWAYKCFMTVIFQDKLIYMPYLPPFARSEKIETYERVCSGVAWNEVRIRSLDGTKISLCTGELKSEFQTENLWGEEQASTVDRHVIICYFQGNGASLPPRLPILSNMLKAVSGSSYSNKDGVSRHTNIRYSIIALSYRGFWTSSGRASQTGIELDAQAMLNWINETYSTNSISKAELVLWGQSVGAGVACDAAARYIYKPLGASHCRNKPSKPFPVTALILETPFVSIKRMLFALYPQKWLPYQYLHRFLWNHWDNEQALRRIAELPTEKQPKILILAATRDEVVPASQATELEKLCKELSLKLQRRDVIGALHTEATLRSEGIVTVSRFIRNEEI